MDTANTTDATFLFQKNTPSFDAFTLACAKVIHTSLPLFMKNQITPENLQAQFSRDKLLAYRHIDQFSYEDFLENICDNIDVAYQLREDSEITKLLTKALSEE